MCGKAERTNGSYCKKCHSKRQTEWVRKRSAADSKFRLQLNEKKRIWRMKHPDRLREIQRRSVLKNKYGLTEEQYAELVKKQKGLCVLCCLPLVGRIDVDHNHKTGEVRGITHQSCNMIIGAVHDNHEVLFQIAKSLARLNRE